MENPERRTGDGAVRAFRFLASLKVAIPLLVLTVVVTIAGSLQPDTDYYRTWWYLGLLGLNGLSLLFVTLLHIPRVLHRKGRNALIGVVLTHLGILVLIAGAIYGGVAGFRHEVRAIEGEMTVVPGLPFVIRLEGLTVEEYPAETFVHMNLDMLPRKRQESRLTLFKGGKPWRRLLAAPGMPARVDGITILPSVRDTGWYFELVARNPDGEETTIPVRPWAPPLITIAGRAVMAHSLVEAGGLTAQVFSIDGDRMTMLGTVSSRQPLELGGHSLSLGRTAQYTGLKVYNRPHAPVLVVGSLAMLMGLLWHFYHRHRDRARKPLEEAIDAG